MLPLLRAVLDGEGLACLVHIALLEAYADDLVRQHTLEGHEGRMHWARLIGHGMLRPMQHSGMYLTRNTDGPAC